MNYYEVQTVENIIRGTISGQVIWVENNTYLDQFDDRKVIIRSSAILRKMNALITQYRMHVDWQFLGYDKRYDRKYAFVVSPGHSKIISEDNKKGIAVYNISSDRITRRLLNAIRYSEPGDPFAMEKF